MALDVHRRRVGSGDHAVEIVDAVGRLDAPGAAILRSTIQQILKESCPRIGINLAECVEIHREMVGTFHSLARACQRAGGGLALFGQAGDVSEYIKRFADAELVSWYERESEAVVALGGKAEAEEPREGGEEPPAVVAVGDAAIFRGVFWKLGKLGGRPVAKFDSIEACFDYINRRPVHSVIIDSGMPAQDTARLVRQIRASARLRSIGVFVVGIPSQKTTGRALVGEGADAFVPLVFSGEEIAAKLDSRAFFAGLKEAYERFDTRAEAKEGR